MASDCIVNADTGCVLLKTNVTVHARAPPTPVSGRGTGRCDGGTFEVSSSKVIVELPFCEPGNGWSSKFFAESYR